jgi:hypothetical protein
MAAAVRAWVGDRAEAEVADGSQLAAADAGAYRRVDHPRPAAVI